MAEVSHMSSALNKGHIFLVGAGPGDPDLLTVKAFRTIQGADVIVHDRLVSPEILTLADPDTQLIDVGKTPNYHPVPQANINAMLVSLAGRYRRIVRLKGGDPYMFGRGSEEASVLRAAGISFTTIPGITAAQGIAASTGVPLTHRGLATGVRFVTGHCRAGHDLELDWQGLADPETTLVVYMGRGHADQIAEQLMRHGLDPTLPVMLVLDGTRPTETRHFSTLATLGQDAKKLERKGPVLIVIGHVVDLAQDCGIPLGQVSHG